MKQLHPHNFNITVTSIQNSKLNPSYTISALVEQAFSNSSGNSKLFLR
jgi:hypothetical protein